MKTWVFLAFLFVGMVDSRCATWFVDWSAKASGTGQRWDVAWNNLAAIDWTKIKPSDSIEIAKGDYEPQSLVIKQSGTAEAPITIRLASDKEHKGGVHIGSVDFAKGSWVTLNGCLDDKFVVPVSVEALDAITNNIGLRIHSSVTGVSVNGVVNGTRLLWTHVFNCGVAGKRNTDAVLIRELQKKLEIGYCWFQDNICGDTINASPGGADWGSISIHDCLVNNIGDDAFQINGGFDIYRCKVQYRTYGSSHGHTDCFQTWGGKIRIHHNVIRNFACLQTGSGYNSISYAQFSTPVAGDFLFYNNLVFDDDPQRLGAPGMALVFDAWWSPGKHNPHVVITNVFIANNLFCKPNAQDLSWKLHGRSDPYRGTNDSYSITNCSFINNIFVDSYRMTSGQKQGVVVGLPGPNSSTPQVTMAPDSIVLANNVLAGPNRRISFMGKIWNNIEDCTLLAGQINSARMPAFVSYTYLVPPYDFRLKRDDTVALDHGYDLSRFTNSIPMLNVDLDGNSRPANGRWDIGPYESSR